MDVAQKYPVHYVGSCLRVSSLTFPPVKSPFTFTSSRPRDTAVALEDGVPRRLNRPNSVTH